jgi:hypothetical protein
MMMLPCNMCCAMQSHPTHDQPQADSAHTAAHIQCKYSTFLAGARSLGVAAITMLQKQAMLSPVGPNVLRLLLADGPVVLTQLSAAAAAAAQGRQQRFAGMVARRTP